MPIRVPKASLSHLECAPLKVAVAQVRVSPVHAIGDTAAGSSSIGWLRALSFRRIHRPLKR